ncbi:hypothetical protein R3W88_031903 [Solanum pinnatisectum]|uniref:Uncharacterized protein n=1 Tax=Solanum pinnatisectum TaxID=50273 RepID=A0AAV9LMP3_9SOLN|nr:hypothetical protein R3W88_031903 [Solanum pinnatisectum]
MNTPTNDLLTKILDKMKGFDMILQGMKSDISPLSTIVISHSSSINTSVYANLHENFVTHVNENMKVATQVSTTVTRSGKTLQERTTPDDVMLKGWLPMINRLRGWVRHK